MKVLVCVLLYLVGTAVSVPVKQESPESEEAKRRRKNKVGDKEGPNVSTRNNWVELIFLDLLEDLRETMINGSDDVPVLDPLEVENVHVELDEFGLDNSHITLNNLKVDQLSTFEIDAFQITIGLLPPQWRMSFDGKIPNIDIEVGHYNADLSVMTFRFWGDGSARITLVEPRVEGRIGIRVRVLGGFYLTIETSDITLYLKEFKSNITGILGDEDASNFINSVLEILIPDLIETYRVEIGEVINSAVLQVGNEILGDLDLGSIFG